MRAFIGFLVPEHVKDAVLKAGKELEGIGVVGKYVERENLHVNLSFLDEITDEESQGFAAKLDMMARGYERFQATLGPLKAIPNEKFTRIIAFEVEQENDRLNTIIKEIKKSIGGDAKPPHLTICRVKGVKDRTKFLEALEKYRTMKLASFDVGSVQLIKSELSSEGPIYSVVHESKFK
jgi:2'-5' RNA ligase